MFLRALLPAAAASAILFAPAVADADAKRFALGVFHFNLQYVAGGLVGMGSPENDRSERAIEDAIIVESFEPVLDLFLAHPTWGQDLELQGYMLEVLAARHPTVLDKLRTLAARKQIEVLSFHYSDQLYIAYPRVDWERSIAATDAIFAGAGIPVSTTVFCQEGQLGLGIAAALPDHGRRTLVWTKQNFGYQHPGITAAPLYTVGGGRVLVTEETNLTAGPDTISATYTFVDDGELLATGGANPYFTFVKKPEALAAYEKKLADLEAQGFAVTPISRYVDALEQAGLSQPPPPLLDGTWQPQSTNSTFKWMGGRAIFGADERDNEVRTLGAIAHRELVVAEAAARAAGLDATAELGVAWKELALGQVSDATGITPIRNEIEYGLAHLTESLRIARSIVTRAKGARPSVIVDANAGTVTDGATAEEPSAPVDPPLAVTVTAPDRPVRVVWRKITPEHLVADVEIDPGDDPRVSVTFAGAPGDIVTTPALASGVVHAPREAFGFQQLFLPLSDGLIGLGGGRFLVKDMAFVHLAARVTPTSGDVTLADETIPLTESARWRFHLLTADDATAAAFANALNVAPKVTR